MNKIKNPKTLLLISGFILAIAVFAVSFLPANCLSDSPSAVAKISTPVNINTADKSTLCLLSGVGEETAQNIIAYRMENGGFDTIEELKNVSGIGEKSYQNIKNYICTE